MPEVGEKGKGKGETEGGERGAGSGEQVGADAIERLGGEDPVLLTSFLSSDPAATLTRLKCSRAEVERGRVIANNRDNLPDPKDDVAVRMWMSRVGDGGDDLAAIFRAVDALAELGVAIRRIRSSGAPLRIDELQINGHDLQNLGLSEGPDVGRVLRTLLEEVLEDPDHNNKEYLLARAMQEL